MRLTDREIAIVKGMLLRGDDQHHIAALFGENSGRIAEIAAGMKPPPSNGEKRVERGRDIAAAPAETLPPPGPYFLNLVSPKDIVLDGLEAVEEVVAAYVSRHGEAGRDIQRRYHSAIAERKRELWKGRQR